MSLSKLINPVWLLFDKGTKTIFNELLAATFIPNWIFDKSFESILDLGCGTGLHMRLIKKKKKIKYCVGVDIYKEAVKQCKKERIYNLCMTCDIREIPFRDKTFDVVMANHVLEHIPKKSALAVVKKMERIAKSIVIISTPIGELSFNPEDNNKYQKHKSFFLPDEFNKMGYRVIKIGGKSLVYEKGLINRIKQFPFLRKLVFVYNILLTPYYLLFQSKCDYYFFAYKRV